MNSKKTKEILKKFGITEINSGVTTGTRWFDTPGDITESRSPIDNSLIAKVKNATLEDYERVMKTAHDAFLFWRDVPAPQRGEIVRQISLALREAKPDLGYLVSLEMGKIYQEGLGEVQEMIDICDFAVGQSRLLNGFTMHSERRDHRMYDQYHSLGIVGLITSFNFPVAVWAWNSMLAAVCGDVIVWKPSSKTPLCAIATQKIIEDVLKKNHLPEGIFNLVIAKSSVLGDNFVADRRIPLFSITGSTRVGKRAGAIISQRLGKAILELGGNNAVIVSRYADLSMAIASTVFGSVGTCGQRCTSTRRIIVHKKVYNEVKYNLINAYEQVSQKIGNPLDEQTLVGPLIDQAAVQAFLHAIEQVKSEGGKVLYGGTLVEGKGFESGNYVVPALVEAENHYKIVQEETFAPILYLIRYDGDIEEAIAINNAVPQGLSSSVFTLNMREAEKFLSNAGSDCGIANVNSGTSGAEIGGAFGGEKDTGSGRESGSDSWKQYMRRQTNTINYSNELPLAQGIKFEF
ncbi:MAG TPA: aldehyde dehydrogenase family protein [Bacteroidales bacterium]|nr:aldehyde dehydrogenase family protein [Bacteroidales bacterium]HPS61442.1 aldehyde dehydrogenase family protein [Bacteroidales bacterium]